MQGPIEVSKVGPSITREPKRKRVSNDEVLRDELDKLKLS